VLQDLTAAGLRLDVWSKSTTNEQSGFVFQKLRWSLHPQQCRFSRGSVLLTIGGWPMEAWMCRCAVDYETKKGALVVIHGDLRVVRSSSSTLEYEDVIDNAKTFLPFSHFADSRLGYIVTGKALPVPGGLVVLSRESSVVTTLSCRLFQTLDVVQMNKMSGLRVAWIQCVYFGLQRRLLMKTLRVPSSKRRR
jgi:hypothetical protein